MIAGSAVALTGAGTISTWANAEPQAHAPVTAQPTSNGDDPQADMDQMMRACHQQMDRMQRQMERMHKDMREHMRDSE
jgi:hypothetical protein